MIEWEWCHFNELDIHKLYAILAARQAVFVVEQNCPYSDADGYDQKSYHLMGWECSDSKKTTLAAYARVIPPTIKRSELAIGRVITTKSFRGKGIGLTLLEKAVEWAEVTFPGSDMSLSAQAHLQHYYRHGGFHSSGDHYDEDGIPHVAMFRRLRVQPSGDS